MQVVKAAEADAEAKYLQGQGIARQRQAIVNGLRESVLNFERDVSDISSRDVIEVSTPAACGLSAHAAPVLHISRLRFVCRQQGSEQQTLVRLWM